MKKILNKKGGFTLIELLVVISIIGLLSSVVLASLSTARDKAKISASVTFAKHSYSKLSGDLLFDVDFNEANLTPKDKTGNYSNSATITNDPDTPLYDKGSSYNKVNNSAALNFTATAFSLANPYRTVSVWFKKTGTLSGTGYIVFANDYHVRMSGTNLECTFFGPIASVSISSVDDGKWHNVLCTNVGSTPIDMYIDGKKVSSSPTNVAYVYGGQTNNRITIGTDYNNSSNYQFPGLIDNVQSFYQYLTSYQAQQIYAQGLPSHTLAENK